jgi:hypothetical protein
VKTFNPFGRWLAVMLQHGWKFSKSSESTLKNEMFLYELRSFNINVPKILTKAHAKNEATNAFPTRDMNRGYVAWNGKWGWNGKKTYMLGWRKDTEIVVAYFKIRFQYSSGQPRYVTSMAATPTDNRIHLPHISKTCYPSLTCSLSICGNEINITNIYSYDYR